MAYQQGGLIEASDYNQIREDVGEVFNDRNSGIFPYIQASSSFGYGVPHISLPVTSGSVVEASEWENLFEEVYRCAVHQNTSTGDVPEPSTAPFSGPGLSVGDLITAYDGSTGLLNLVNDIRANKLIFNPGFFSVTSGGNMLTDNRTVAWSNTINHQFGVEFSNIENVRYFFNSGGQIIFSASRTGGASNSQNTAWTNELDAMQDVMFGATRTTTNGNGVAALIGLYDMTTTNQLVFSKNVIEGGAYGGDDKVEIYARLSNNFQTDFTLVFTFRCIPDNSIFEGNTIDGTLTSYIDKRVAETYVPPPQPLASTDFTTLTSLNVGG